MAEIELMEPGGRKRINREEYLRPDYLYKVAKLIEDFVIKETNQVAGPLKHGIIAGVSNIPLSLQSLGHYVDLLHGGAYKIPTNQTPYYQPGVQAQLNLTNLITGQPVLVDINAGFELSIIGGFIIPTHPNPVWIAMPWGSKPEQQEAIINSAVPHVLPKLISDYDYFLGKEWNSLFFTEALVSAALTSFSTNIRTLAQAGEGVGNVITKAAEELG